HHLRTHFRDEEKEDQRDGQGNGDGLEDPRPVRHFTKRLIMSTILSRVSGLRIHALAPELGNISSSDFSGRSEIRTMGMSFVLDCDFSTSLDRKSTRLNSSHQIISYAV